MAEIRMVGCTKTVEEMQKVMDEINQFYELVANEYNIDLDEEKRRAFTVKSDLMEVVRKAEK